MSAEELRFDRLGPGSADRFAALHARCFEAPWGAAFFSSLLNLPGTIGVLARRGASPAALGLVRAIAGEAEILTLAVAPEARRQGLGAAMIGELLARARAHDAGVVHLEVSVRNRAARALYAGLGFEEKGRRKGYYADGADAVVCRRVLGTSPN